MHICAYRVIFRYVKSKFRAMWVIQAAATRREFRFWAVCVKLRVNLAECQAEDKILLFICRGRSIENVCLPFFSPDGKSYTVCWMGMGEVGHFAFFGGPNWFLMALCFTGITNGTSSARLETLWARKGLQNIKMTFGLNILHMEIKITS